MGCKLVIRHYGSYAVKLADHVESPLTGEVKEVELVGRICKSCARRAGYKIKDSSIGSPTRQVLET